MTNNTTIRKTKSKRRKKASKKKTSLDAIKLRNKLKKILDKRAKKFNGDFEKIEKAFQKALSENGKYKITKTKYK